MRYGSVCSGIEAASAAWHTLGWQPAWFAEIEAFPSAVLAHHYPDVPNIGDFTQIAGAIEAEAIEAPDVLVGGTPCQAFSVAGLRMSLADARGNLSLAFVELANAIDNFRRNRGQPAGIIVWENVPGVLNTSDNAFGCFVGGLAGCDTPISAPPGRGWTDSGVVLGPKRAVAWRILDAQYFGLAQRRRRVFVVASARDGFDPGAVLLEWDGLRRDSAPSREARERIAGGAQEGLGVGGAAVTMAHGQGGAEVAEDRAPTLTCNHEAPIAFLPETAHTLRAEGFDASEDGTGRGTPLVPVSVAATQGVAVPLQEVGKRTGVSTTDPRAGIGIGQDGDAMYTLQAGAQHGVAVSVALRGRDGGAACEVGDDVAFTLRASSGGGDKPHVMAPIAFPANLSGTQCASTEDLAPAMGAKNPTAVATAMQVRRLTPRECERLQGFPDGYTAIPWRKKPASECPDGPRYKALGNSMAVPVMRWIGARIARQVTP